LSSPAIHEFGCWTVIPQYVIFGLACSLVTILDDGLELAWGNHTAHNVFSSLFTVHETSALQTDALFKVGNLDVVNGPWTMAVMLIAFVLIVSSRYKLDYKLLFLKVEDHIAT
jgi:hypothetical protein